MLQNFKFLIVLVSESVTLNIKTDTDVLKIFDQLRC